MALTDFLMILAILIGPTIGVFLVKKVDEEKEKRRRREDVFKILMRTRKDPITQDHVGALNLVELEFEKEEKVLNAFKEYFTNLNTQHKKSDRETDQEFNIRIYQDRQALLAKLLHAMAKILNFKIEQLEIFEGGYIPQGWGDERSLQKLLQLGLNNILSGTTPIKVVLVESQNLPQEKAKDKQNKSR